MNFDCPYCKQEGIESTVACDGNVDHRSVEGSANYKHYFVLRKEEEEELLVRCSQWVNKDTRVVVGRTSRSVLGTIRYS